MLMLSNANAKHSSKVEGRDSSEKLLKGWGVFLGENGDRKKPQLNTFTWAGLNKVKANCAKKHKSLLLF